MGFSPASRCCEVLEPTPRDSGNATLSTSGANDEEAHVESSTIVHFPNLGVTL